MRVADSAAALLTLTGLAALALVAPWPVAVLIAVAGIAALPTGRLAFAAFAATTLAINAGILWLAEGDPARGILGGARIVAALAANVAILGRVGAARVLDGLRLPPRVAAPIAAVLLAARDVGADFARMKDARVAQSEWPRGILARVREAARLLPPLFVMAQRRARIRRDALWLAGHAVGPSFVPIVAVAALAAAGRMAFLALPNVALTFVVVFLGGLLYGARVGMIGGALAMLVTDFYLSGLYPLALVNVPAMALLALAGAAMRHVDFVGGSRADRSAGTIFAFLAGAVGTFAFSVASDTLTWLVIAPGSAATWKLLVLAGLVFNVVPALVNGALFALSVRPVLAAFQALREGGARAPTDRAPRVADARQEAELPAPRA